MIGKRRADVMILEKPAITKEDNGICNIDLLPFDENIKKKLQKLIAILISLPTINRIILFGSYAKMEYHVGSDLDLLVLTDSEISREQRGHLHSVFEEQGADLVFYTVSEMRDSTCYLVKEIRKDGILLWEA
jgi:predicted nucleotidyltransferase